MLTAESKIIGVNAAGIPAGLTDHARWVCWKAVPKTRKDGTTYRDKQPRRAASPWSNASTTERATWGTFAQAVAAYRSRKVDGIGFVLCEGFLGIDLDDVRDPDTGELVPAAQAIVDRLDTYTEVSPSGGGVKLFLRGSVPESRKRPADGIDVEIYGTETLRGGRYFTVTGQRQPGTPDDVALADAERMAEVIRLWEQMGPKTARRQPADLTPVVVPNGYAPTDGEVVEVGRQHCKGFATLWEGDSSQHGGDDSAGDQGLANHLAWLCGPNGHGQVRRLMMQSGRKRDKFESNKTYLERTIAKAYEGGRAFYEWRRNAPPPASRYAGVTVQTLERHADPSALVGELVPYRPIRTRSWGNLTVEMRWAASGKQAVRILDGEVPIEMATMKVETLSTRESFTRKVAKQTGRNAAELNRLLVEMAGEGCPPTPTAADTALPTPTPVASYPEDIDGRPAVFVGGSGLARSIALDRCQRLVAAEFYQADEALVSVDVCSNRGAHIVRPITVERLAAWLDTHVAFYVVDPDTGEQRQVPSPDWLCRRMFNLQTFVAVRPVNGIATGPFMRPDGTVGGYASGYDELTGVVVSTSVEWPTIPDRPTRADAEAAVATLLDAVKTFPFRGPIDRSVWLASVLTTVGRQAFAGPAPMFVATAPVMGSGKSLLQQAASWIATGTDAPAAKLGGSDVENEKVIGAVLACRPTCIVFDNVSGTLGDPTIDRMLTAEVIMSRILGQSKNITVRNTFVAFANGNNLAPRGDIGRRILHMRLEPDTDRPHEIQHDGDFRGIIMARRPQLLAAALTILRHGMTIAEPPRIRRLGSYARWGAVVQTALVAAGQPDPAESQGEMLSDAQDVVGELVAAIAEAMPEFRDTAARLVERAFERNTFGGGGFVDDTAAGSRLRDAIDAVVEQHRGGRPGRLEDVRSTIMLRVVEAIRDRWFADCRLVRDAKGKHGRRWRIERRGDAWEPAG